MCDCPRGHANMVFYVCPIPSWGNSDLFETHLFNSGAIWRRKRPFCCPICLSLQLGVTPVLPAILLRHHLLEMRNVPREDGSNCHCIEMRDRRVPDCWLCSISGWIIATKCGSERALIIPLSSDVETGVLLLLLFPCAPGCRFFSIFYFFLQQFYPFSSLRIHKNFDLTVVPFDFPRKVHYAIYMQMWKRWIGYTFLYLSFVKNRGERRTLLGWVICSIFLINFPEILNVYTYQKIIK